MTTRTRNRSAARQATPAYRPSPLRIGLARGRIELTEFLREREAVVFTLAFPVMLLIIFGAVLDFDITEDGRNVRFTEYFVAGILAAGIFGVCFQALAIQIPVEREKGLLKRLRGTPMPPSAYFLGKIILVIGIGILEIALLLTVAALFYDVRLPAEPDKWLTFGWVTVLGAVSCTLLGIAFSSVPRSAKAGPAVVTPIAIALQFISGVFFVFTALPTWMQTIGALFPLKWMAQGMRSVFLPDWYGAQEPAGSFELGRTALVLAAWAVAGLVVSRLTFRWKSHRDG